MADLGAPCHARFWSVRGRIPEGGGMVGLSSGLFLLALMGGLHRVCGSQGARELAALSRGLQGLEQDGRPLGDEPRVLAAWRTLEGLRKRALFRGADPRCLMALVCEELTQAQLHAREGEQFMALLRWRWALCLGLAAAGRYWLLGLQPTHPLRFANQSWLAADGLLLVIALVFALSSYVLLQGKYPRHWLWIDGFSVDALAWLGVVFLDHPGQGSEALGRLWQQVKLQEQRQGQAHDKNRHLTLSLWSKEKKIEQLFMQRKFDDCLPLWELGALGLPACCLLAAPALPFVLRL